MHDDKGPPIKGIAFFCIPVKGDWNVQGCNDSLCIYKNSDIREEDLNLKDEEGPSLKFENEENTIQTEKDIACISVYK